MRILIYGLNYAPEPTGIGKYTGEMGSWFVKRGHSVDAIVAPPYYPSWHVPEEYRRKRFLSEYVEGVRVHRVPLFVPKPNGLNARTRILHETSFNAAATRYWLPRLFAERRYDVVVAVCQPIQIAGYPYLYSRLRGVPFVLHVQDLQVDVAVRLGMLPKGELTNILYGIENGILRLSDRVSTITEAMRNRIVDKGVQEENAWLFPNWADIKFVHPMPADDEMRREFGASPEDILVMYAGTMGEKQGLDLVLEAAELLKGRAGIKVAMIGGGGDRERLYRETLRRRLENVRFYPVQPLERLPLMLAAGDIHLVVQQRAAADLVMPSKLTNILAAGRPSVATAEPGTALHDVLNRYNCGITTVPGSAEELTAGILALADNVQERKRLGLNARSYAETYLDKEKILSDFESKLLELVETSQ